MGIEVKKFFKELLVGCAISGVIGLGAGIFVASCIDRITDRYDEGPDASATVEEDGGVPR